MHTYICVYEWMDKYNLNEEAGAELKGWLGCRWNRKKEWRWHLFSHLKGVGTATDGQSGDLWSHCTLSSSLLLPSPFVLLFGRNCAVNCHEQELWSDTDTGFILCIAADICMTTMKGWVAASFRVQASCFSQWRFLHQHDLRLFFLLSAWTVSSTKEGTYSTVVLGFRSFIPITDTMAAGWSFHKAVLETSGKCVCAQAQVREKIMKEWRLLLWGGLGSDS